MPFSLRSEEHTSELQSRSDLVCRLLLEKKTSITLRTCSSKIITSILSFISGRLASKSNPIKQLIRNGRSASLQRTFKKSFSTVSHTTTSHIQVTEEVQDLYLPSNIPLPALAIAP